MRFNKLIVGATVAVAALLSACGSGASADGSTSSTTAPTSSAASETTTQPPSTSTAAPTTSSAKPTTTTSKSTPKSTTSKPSTPKPGPAEGAPCTADASACIDLSANRAWLLTDGKVTYGPVPITHGRPGWRTPPGTFRVQWKNIDHKSREFDNAPMPYSVFFNGGIAFHAGSLRQLSHGCIHLSTAAAKAFFVLPVGAVVQVVP
ncbi:lipoprotein-anchoring transpeptidase ErfK/SrfK [Herbihabitans rhizosphaerae]|uniref:Lipoprotein-anchoring transpeptidase ErfK/SrfK n=1 Tax=Herbihabitans rhizosphaerae TaxID=1872711 RepID=A0A4Q7L549_9PSEU|nr:L,D-transpeptidase [Herbihabitans rhizosphaerae]RZS44384.1 lipoprotein-anchoring transpeptidase ErfK/SrfK [Herbihabitans rhizosphaerae]